MQAKTIDSTSDGQNDESNVKALYCRKMSTPQYSDVYGYTVIKILQDGFMNAETFNPSCNEGPQILRSLCGVQAKYRHIETAQVFIDEFLKARNADLNNMRKHFGTHLFVKFRNNNDFFSMVTVLRCRDFAIQKKILEIIPTMTFSLNVATVDETELIDALDTLLLVLQLRMDNVDFLQKLYSPILDTFSLLLLKSLITRGTSTLQSSDVLQRKVYEYKKIVSKKKHDRNFVESKPILEVIHKFVQTISESQFKNFRVFEGWPNVLGNENELSALFQRASKVSVTDLYTILYGIMLQILQHSNQTASTFLKTHVHELLSTQANKWRRDLLFQPILSLLLRGIENIIELEMSTAGEEYTDPHQALKSEDMNMFELLCLCKSCIDPRLMFVSYDGIHRLLFKYKSEVKPQIVKELTPPCKDIETLHCRYIQWLVPGLHLNVQKGAGNKWCFAAGSIFGETDIILHFHIKEREANQPDITIRDNELDILSQLQKSETHNNIMHLLVHQIYQSPKFYILELPKKKLFRTLIQMRNNAHSRVSFKQLQVYVLEILSAIEYLHKKKITHRNIMCRHFSIRNGTVVLANMTLAKKLNDASSLMVSAKDICPHSIPTRWTAPESITEDTYNELSDVWMLGMTMYELFTLGSQPFSEMKSYSIDDIMIKVVFHSLQTYKWSSIPEKVHRTILHCTRTDPKERPIVSSLRNAVESWEFDAEGSANPSHLLIDSETKAYPRLDPAEEKIETGIPSFFKDLKQKPRSDMRTTYFQMKNNGTSGLTAHVIREHDITPSDPPIIAEKRGLIVVKEPVSPNFVENVSVEMTEDFEKKMLLSKKPREEARGLNKFYLICSFEDGKSLVDMACAQGLLKWYKEDNGKILSTLYEVTDLVMRIHEKRWLFRDLCAKNIYISKSSQKAYFTRVSRMVRLPKTSNGVYHDEELNDDMVYWYPREVFINRDFSKASDVYMLAMCFYEFFATIEIIQDDPQANTLQRVPYADTSKTMILEKIYNGEKLRCPEGCPDWLYRTMVSCWSRDVTKRPSIEEIQHKFAERLSEAEISPTAPQRSVSDTGPTFTARPQSENVSSNKSRGQKTRNLSVSETSRAPSHWTPNKTEQRSKTDNTHWNFKCHAKKHNTRDIHPFSHNKMLGQDNPIFESASSTLLTEELECDDTVDAADDISNKSSGSSDYEIEFENDSDSE